MSGDVFGNGMLLSPQIRLVAAFDHRDIFLDPDPDPARSFAERRRLFALPRSSWQDYDKSLISSGRRRVLARRSNRAAQRRAAKVPGDRARDGHARGDHECPVAGVGRPALARRHRHLREGLSETNADAGDRANDAIRVNANELRVKVIGEGANLGLTQKGRIEYARAGGRINTDAIDNSAGVNSSDLEVNIKIGLSAAEAAGKLRRDRAQRASG